MLGVGKTNKNCDNEGKQQNESKNIFFSALFGLYILCLQHFELDLHIKVTGHLLRKM